MLLYSHTKIKVRLPDRDIDFFDIVAVLQGDILTPDLFMIGQDYVLRTSIDLIKETGKEQMIPRSNCYGRRIYRWHSTSCK